MNPAPLCGARFSLQIAFVNAPVQVASKTFSMCS